MSVAFAFLEMVARETKARIYERTLAIATALGVPTTTWEVGDPTRSLYHACSEILEVADTKITTYIKGCFLDWAAELAVETGDARVLKKLAVEQYNYVATEATYATTTITLTNTGGGNYPIGVGDLTVKNSSTEKTYHNTSGGTLTRVGTAGATLTLDIVADEPGSESSAAATEIDEMVTTYLGVTCSNAAAARGLDEESPASIVQGCREKLGPLSPNGPWDAYASVARNPELTGTTEVTRCRVFAESDTGEVLVVLAGAAGAVSGGAVTAAEDAVVLWSLPQCITPTVISATNNTIVVTYQLWIYESDSRTDAEIQTAVADALAALFQRKPIGGDVKTPPNGRIYRQDILGTIKGVSTYTFDATLAAPAADVVITIDVDGENVEVAALGAITPTITRVEDP